ncbi:hypothetical protein DWV46_08185 [Sellimonas intestinalis]|nr:hypothetical protein DWV46_08185 [Sellimonas intestinalis]
MISRKKIEARDSSVCSGQTDVPSAEQKGETAEGSKGGRNFAFWDVVEDTAYCHRLWSAIVESEQISEP